MESKRIQFPAVICLYEGTDPERLDLGEMADYLSSRLTKTKIELRKDIKAEFLEALPSQEEEKVKHDLAKRLAQAKVHDIQKPHQSREPLYGEVEFERKWLSNQKGKPIGILYDGFELQKIYFDLLPVRERELGYLHIVFTGQLFGTFDEADKRYHARVSTYGFPCVLSSSGLVEAPAKPREFYLERQMGVDTLELKKKFAGRFIDYDDSRLTDAMKGYVMQALFYLVLGDPFCNDNRCRLFNAHWQEELIRAQLSSDYEFCPFHQEVLESMK